MYPSKELYDSLSTVDKGITTKHLNKLRDATFRPRIGKGGISQAEQHKILKGIKSAQEQEDQNEAEDGEDGDLDAKGDDEDAEGESDNEEENALC